MVRHVPFNRCFLTGKEFTYIQQAIDNMHISGDGAFTARCAALIEKTLGVARALLTTSCTHALEMAALLLDIQPGDEVICPSFTFVSTVNAFVLRGARPVFVDIRPDTLNMDENRLAELVTDRTRAIAPVHYAGVGCEMDVILRLAAERNLAVVEDNAHGLFGKYNGRYLGSFGQFAVQSFHETKNVTCGEGGALLINDPRYVERAEILREKGTNRSRFFRGEVDKYTWVDIGSSYLPSDILAAFLWAQLEAREQIQCKRAAIWNYYHEHLQEWAVQSAVQLPHVPAACQQPYHLYYLVMPSAELRQALIEHLKARGVMSVFHYVPLHLSEKGRSFGYGPGDFPVTERMAAGLLRLPFHNYLTEADLAHVVKCLQEFKGAAQ